MKLIKTASGKKIKMSKKEWEEIGKIAGWTPLTKEADEEQGNVEENGRMVIPEYEESMKEINNFLKVSNALRQLVEIPKEQAMSILQSIYKATYLVNKMENPDYHYSDDPIENFIYGQLNKYNSMPQSELQARYDIISGAMKKHGIEVVKW